MFSNDPQGLGQFLGVLFLFAGLPGMIGLGCAISFVVNRLRAEPWFINHPVRNDPLREFVMPLLVGVAGLGITAVTVFALREHLF